MAAMERGMLQYCVEKSGYVVASWSDRVLSVPVGSGGGDDLHIVHVSRKDHPEVLVYHSMVVQEVRLWPHYHGEYMDRVVLNDGDAAKRVIGVHGLLLEPGANAPVDQLENHIYWKLRFQDLNTLKEAVAAIRGREGTSTVDLKGSFDCLGTQAGTIISSVQEQADEPVY